MSGRASPPSAFDPVTPPKPEQFDPFRLCVYTTVAVLAWLLTPAAVVALFSGVALVAYFRARRAGLVKSKCKLGDTRLVMAYLAVAFFAGAYFTVQRLTTML
ncbi:MAG TPA: hypothetical protein VMS99_03015 [Acidimicrobiia bacterium]|nr:hypothetical protein [Acidimicrobiia bacterium]